MAMYAKQVNQLAAVTWRLRASSRTITNSFQLYSGPEQVLRSDAQVMSPESATNQTVQLGLHFNLTKSAPVLSWQTPVHVVEGLGMPHKLWWFFVAAC